MKLQDFTAAADIIGRRVRVSWVFVPDESETLADVERVTLRRKLRDFAFPPPAAADPYLVYDSKTFPPPPAPGSLSVTDLATWEETHGGERTVFEPVSVAVNIGGRPVEILRRTTGTTYNAEGVPVRQRVEILDTGGHPGGLKANTVYYYQLFGNDLPADGADAEPFRASVMVTDAYGLNRTLYESLPEVYRRHDVEMRPETPGFDSVPEQAPLAGQLRRFTDLFGIPLDSLRGTAEGLRTLRDVDNVDARYLTQLARWIGWDLSVGADIPLRRNEIKTATRMYGLVGTLPGLRSLVSQYTGWTTQVAEFAQNLALANRPPRRNLFAITPGAGGASWHGADDAAALLGFPSGNQEAVGSAGLAATLTGTAVQPFALRPGMELTLSVDGLPPSTVRFGRDDFAGIESATAAEVAAAIDRAIPEVRARAVGGAVRLTSETVGVESSLVVTAAPTSLVSLENAPAGRLSTATDSLGRIRLFYEAWETPTRPEAGLAPAGAQAPGDAGGYVLRRVRYKTYLEGAWLDSHPVFDRAVTPQADPAALALPGDRLWAAWVDDPQTAASRLRYAVGVSRPPLPARLLGQRREPFKLADGAVLTLVGDWAGADTYQVLAGDFADEERATAAEVVAAMNAQLSNVTASRERDGSIRLETVGTGPRAEVSVDLRQSTTARALGFDQRNAAGTRGSWSEVVDWSAPLDAVSVAQGRHAELAAVNDPAGGVRVAWARHHAGRWRIQTARWDERVFVATANGLFTRVGRGPWVSVAGLPSNNVRAVAVDSNGTAWLATAAGAARRNPDGTVNALAPPLASNDVRSVVLAPDGTAWFATAGGVEGRALGGAVTTITTVNGLPSNDTRAVALTDAGALWVATGAGTAERSADGSIRVFDVTNGLPSNDVRDVAVAADGTSYHATAAGLAVRSPAGDFTLFNSARDIASPDVRAVRLKPDGTVWAATLRGVSRRSADGQWTTFGTGDGLAAGDARTIFFGPDGAAWAGTSAGVSVITEEGAVRNFDLVGGAADPAAQSVHTGWSSTLELAGGGGGNREPALAVDAAGRTWLVWSQRLGEGNPDESWGLRGRIYDPAAGTWGAELTLTTPPVGGRSADRTPSVLAQPAGVRIFFSSDRDGGFGLRALNVTSGGVAGPQAVVIDEASSDVWPTPVNVGGAVWLLYRSDRNVSLAQVGESPLGRGARHSARVSGNGTVRSYAGSVSLVLADLPRLRGRRLFGDVLSYTPNRPDGVGALADDELYTRGTIGLYLSHARKGNPLTRREIERLREVLARFIPVNLRAVMIVVASTDLEFVYPPGAEILDGYLDAYPFAETLGGLSDLTAAAMPGLVILVSNDPAHVSADPADQTTLRRRTFFPPLQ